MEFGPLRTLIADKDWNESIDALLVQKKAADEKALITPVALLQQWIGETLVYCNWKASALEPGKPDIVLLDVLFRKYTGYHDL